MIKSPLLKHKNYKQVSRLLVNKNTKKKEKETTFMYSKFFFTFKAQIKSLFLTIEQKTTTKNLLVTLCFKICNSFIKPNKTSLFNIIRMFFLEPLLKLKQNTFHYRYYAFFLFYFVNSIGNDF